jgi:hypothetical protein
MSQVTIYLEEDTLAAAKTAAARAQMSVSKWFAQFAEAEKQKPAQSWDQFFAEIDSLDTTNLDATDGWDGLLKDRYSGLGTDVPRQSF